MTKRSRWPGIARWFLPQTPDVLRLLVEQGETTVAGMEAFAAWAKGDRAREADVRSSEHEADKASRAVLTALREAFVTSISPEDAYELSERLDRVLNAAKDLVREADVLGMEPDEHMAHMAELTVQGVRDLVRAFPDLAANVDRATAFADAAVRQQRALEHAYRRAMSALLEKDDVRLVTGSRELYRRFARIGDSIEGVAHRIWYAVVKAQ